MPRRSACRSKAGASSSRRICRRRPRRSNSAIALNPRDPVARYRYGRVLQARRDDAGALAQFELTIRDARLAPAPIVGDAYLEDRAHPRARRPPRRGDRRLSRRPRHSSAPARDAPHRRARAGTPRSSGAVATRPSDAIRVDPRPVCDPRDPRPSAIRVIRVPCERDPRDPLPCDRDRGSASEIAIRATRVRARRSRSPMRDSRPRRDRARSIARSRSSRQEKGVQVFDFSCTLCLTVIFLIHNLHLV